MRTDLMFSPMSKSCEKLLQNAYQTQSQQEPQEEFNVPCYLHHHHGIMHFSQIFMFQL